MRMQRMIEQTYMQKHWADDVLASVQQSPKRHQPLSKVSDKAFRSSSLKVEEIDCKQSVSHTQIFEYKSETN
jgi:hypothetical protein